MKNIKRANDLSIIGATEYIEVAGIKNVPAKTDTGADSSSIWASNISMQKDGTLVFSLFGEKSPFYTKNTIKTKKYTAKSVRSSHGDAQIRYRVELPLTIGGKTLNTTFTLANRTRNNFPILIGRRTLKGNFLVDVSIMNVEKRKAIKSRRLNQELQKDPYEFHQKYIQKGKK